MVVTVVVVQRKVAAVTQPVSRSADVKRVEYVPSAFIVYANIVIRPETPNGL